MRGIAEKWSERNKNGGLPQKTFDAVAAGT